ncbi:MULTISPECIES: glutaredoxin domain-containing protein [unclassified Thioalkalivibrio]|uniref:glutaredoxin domain-containing protein n=1 Tax=unclassified Thioalkalivibrio TaxID=2621013 RepID=UPI00035DE201|nr:MULTISPECIES: glutaredoxin domain-containing protein [unclassified Thioalkalivibrio]
MRFEVYGTVRCPFCLLARRLLIHRGYSFDDFPVDREPGARAEMEQRAGRHSVPQIFLGETHIGGYDELQALDHSGDLHRMAEAAGVQRTSDA